MWSRTVSVSELVKLPRWVLAGLGRQIEEMFSTVYPVHTLGSLVDEVSQSVDPTKLPWSERLYVGLEHVEGFTGLLQTRVTAAEVGAKSRSKTFAVGDVLYGRLRAYLNKVHLVSEEDGLGTCSGEFYVLRPQAGRVEGGYLRMVLASAPVRAEVAKRLGGATHPRLGLEDLLSFPIPVPPIELQRSYITRLDLIYDRLAQLRGELAQMPDQLEVELRDLLVGEELGNH